MVNIAGMDFNKDMDSYITKRREEKEAFELESHKKKPSRVEFEEEPERRPKKTISMSTLFRKRIPTDEEIQEHMKKTSAKDQKDVEEIQEKIEDIEEAEDELEIEKESLFRRLFRKMGFGKSSEVVSDDELERIQEEQTMVDAQTKETLKILHRWLEQLPPEKMEAFKRSSDFQKYKELLKKLGMIKQ